LPSWRRDSLPFQNDMDLAGNKSIPSIFTESKQSLELACSYVIFERAIEFNESRHFSEIMHALSPLRKKNPVWRICRDKERSKLLLVVKMEREKTEVFFHGIIQIGLPKD